MQNDMDSMQVQHIEDNLTILIKEVAGQLRSDVSSLRSDVSSLRSDVSRLDVNQSSMSTTLDIIAKRVGTLVELP